MKKFLSTILLLFISWLAFAQTPLEEAVDFSAKDIHGVTHHLFDILDNEQQYVFIDFFSVTCGPCQALAPKLDSVYTYFGSNELDLFVLAIDYSFNNEMVADFEEEYNTHYPAISGADGGGALIFDDYEIPYYPSLILIAPDHSIVEQAIPVPNTAQELIDLLENTYGLQAVSVQEVKSETSFKLYPNPANNYVVVQTPMNKEVESLCVFSITGKELLRKQSFSDPQNVMVNIENLSKGMYLLSVEYTDGSRFSNRFVKK